MHYDARWHIVLDSVCYYAAQELRRREHPHLAKVSERLLDHFVVAFLHVLFDITHGAEVVSQGETKGVTGRSSCGIREGLDGGLRLWRTYMRESV